MKGKGGRNEQARLFKTSWVCYSSGDGKRQQNTNNDTPQKLFDKIEKASVNFGIENQTASPYIAYRRGATEWTEKAQPAIDALDELLKQLPSGDILNYYFAREQVIKAPAALAKYKEVIK